MAHETPRQETKRSFQRNYHHLIGTCENCGGEMIYNVPRLGKDGGFIHKHTLSSHCEKEPQAANTIQGQDWLLRGAINLLAVAKCPNCDGSGSLLIDGDQEGDQEQCQWCDARRDLSEHVTKSDDASSSLKDSSLLSLNDILDQMEQRASTYRWTLAHPLANDSLKLVKALRRAVRAIEVMRGEHWVRSDISPTMELEEIAAILTQAK